LIQNKITINQSDLRDKFTVYYMLSLQFSVSTSVLFTYHFSLVLEISYGYRFNSAKSQ